MPSPLALALTALLLAGCGSAQSASSQAPSESSVTTTVRHSWSATVTGTVVRVERQNVDKTLRNPKWFVDIYVEPTKVEAPEGKSVAEGEIQFSAKETDLLKMTGGTLPKEGDTFVGTGRTTDDVATVLELTGADLP